MGVVGYTGVISTNWEIAGSNGWDMQEIMGVSGRKWESAGRNGGSGRKWEFVARNGRKWELVGGNGSLLLLLSINDIDITRLVR